MIRSIFVVFLALPSFGDAIAQSGKTHFIDEDIQLIHLQDSIYIHKTYHYFEAFGRFPSNGLVVIKNGQALLVDTPIDNAKTEKLSNYIKDSLGAEIKQLVIGHFHEDCLGGLEYLKSIGVSSLANLLTLTKCIEDSLSIPSESFTGSKTFSFNGEAIECRFFGGGHSFDNITVWLPNQKILVGGCMVRASSAKGLGNLSDAVLAEWDGSIQKVWDAYPNANIVIPGHGNYGGTELLSHTLELVKAHKAKN
ncbi:MAG: metallo-beta-lactamase class B [Arcticibacterium sp.]|jgi:metallo-beta-lactamase class B